MSHMYVVKTSPIRVNEITDTTLLYVFGLKKGGNKSVSSDVYVISLPTKSMTLSCAQS